jgi:glycosidase
MIILIQIIKVPFMYFNDPERDAVNVLLDCSEAELNWRNSELKAILFSDIKFWLDMGVDGFRLDVINLIGKDKKLRNVMLMISLMSFL